MQFVPTKQTVFFGTLILLLMSVALPVQAEFSLIEESEFCPIPALPTVAVQAVSEQSESSEGVISLAVSNPTEYVFPEAYIGVGLYTENQMTPEYVYFLSEPMLINAGSFENIGVPFSTQYVAEGEYELKAFIAQGDEQAALSQMLRSADVVAGVEFEKTATAESVTTEITINTSSPEVAALGESVQIAFSVNNESPQPVLASEYEVLVVSGRLPVAAATLESGTESVKLIPGGSTNRTVFERAFPIGTHTVYGYLSAGTHFTPLSVEEFVVEEAGIDTYPYIEMMGMSNIGEREGLSFTTCVAQTSEEYAPAPFQVHLNSEKDSFSIDSDEYTSVTVQDSSIRQDVYAVELFKISDTSRREDPDTGEVMTDSYVPVERVEVRGLCGEDGCEEVVVSEESDESSGGLQNTYLYLIALLPISLIVFIIVLLFGKKDKEDEVEMHKPEV